jgi:hypothetical protein
LASFQLPGSGVQVRFRASFLHHSFDQTTVSGATAKIA